MPRTKKTTPEQLAAEGVRKRIRAGDAAPAPASTPMPKGKLGALVALLGRPEGASIGDMMQATGWQAHSVRGAIAGAIKKKLGHAVTSAKADGPRIYRIVQDAAQ